jgi:hypothetical protein
MSGAKGRRRAARVVFALAIVALVAGVAAGLTHAYSLADWSWAAGLHR